VRATLSRIRADIGGKHLADPSLFYLTGPAWFVLSILVVPNISEPSVLMAASLANLVSLTTYLALLVLARDTLFRRRHLHPIPLSAVVLVGAALGAIKGAMTVVIIQALLPGSNYLEALPTRMIAAAIVGVTMLAGASMILATMARFQDESDALVALAADSTANTPLLLSRTSESPDFLRVRQLVKDTRTALSDPPGSPATTPPALEQELLSALRLLSHELWEKSRSHPDVFTVPRLLGTVLSDHRYPAWWVAIFYVITVSLPFTLPLAGPLETLGRLVLLSGLIGAVLWITSALPHATPAWGLAHFTTAMALIAIVNELSSNALFGQLEESSALVISVGNFLAISMTCLIVSVFSVSHSTAQQIRAELQERFGQDYGAQVIQHRRHQLRLGELAQTLHGALTHTVNWKGHPTPEDPAPAARNRLLSELDDLEKYLDNAEFPDGQRPKDWRAHVLTGIERWDGLLDITVDVAVTADPPPTVTRYLLPVINEGLANALRHGLAHSVNVTVAEHDDHIVVDIIDDGVGVRGGSPGLGSALFDEVSRGHWSITPAASGSGTHLRVPLRG